jgi:transcription elongation factor Elf1
MSGLPWSAVAARATQYPQRLTCLTCGEAWFSVSLTAPGLAAVFCGQCGATVLEYGMDEAEMPFARMMQRLP